MSQRRTPREIKRYDQAKYAVGVLLLLLIALLFITTSVRNLNQPEAPAAVAPATPVPTYTVNPAFAAAPSVRGPVEQVTDDGEAATIASTAGTGAQSDAGASQQDTAQQETGQQPAGAATATVPAGRSIRPYGGGVSAQPDLRACRFDSCICVHSRSFADFR